MNLIKTNFQRRKRRKERIEPGCQWLIGFCQFRAYAFFCALCGLARDRPGSYVFPAIDPLMRVFVPCQR